MLRTLQSGEGPAEHVLTTASTRLQKDLSWIQALNPQQRFCWGIVATYSSMIPSSIVTDKFELDPFLWHRDLTAWSDLCLLLQW